MVHVLIIQYNEKYVLFYMLVYVYVFVYNCADFPISIRLQLYFKMLWGLI